MEETGKVIEAMQQAKRPLKVKEIIEISGLDKTIVDKIMKELKKTETVTSPKACYWELKK